MANDPVSPPAFQSRPVDQPARATSFDHHTAPADGFAPVIPEFAVSDMTESLSFWCSLLGFEVTYNRSKARFHFLLRGPLQVMLYERDRGWETAEMQRPFGRGINLQMTVGCIKPILQALQDAGRPLYEGPKEAWYRIGNHEVGQHEFLVQDPDGYLLRFAKTLGMRPVTQP